MARSLSHAALLAVALSERAGLAFSRRSYSAATAVGRSVQEKAVESSKSKKMGRAPESSTAASSWVPDPVTGYYRPANRTAELDAADLRKKLLSRRFFH